MTRKSGRSESLTSLYIDRVYYAPNHTCAGFLIRFKASCEDRCLTYLFSLQGHTYVSSDTDEAKQASNHRELRSVFIMPQTIRADCYPIDSLLDH